METATSLAPKRSGKPSRRWLSLLGVAVVVAVVVFVIVHVAGGGANRHSPREPAPPAEQVPSSGQSESETGD